MRQARYTDEALIKAVSESFSFAEVLRRLGCRQAGGSQAHITRRTKKMGIDTSHFLGQRSNKGKAPATKQSASEILIDRPNSDVREKHLKLKRALLEIGRKHECEGCGTGPVWMGLPMSLHIDHKNGSWTDDRADNLRFLCPNCHATTDNFGNKRNMSV